jgi:hypothetical protein
MGRQAKVLQQVLSRSSDHSIHFDELCSLLRRMGFLERIRGSHHVFFREDVTEQLNLQRLGSGAKGYQVRQVRKLLLEYGMVALPSPED